MSYVYMGQAPSTAVVATAPAAPVENKGIVSTVMRFAAMPLVAFAGGGAIGWYMGCKSKDRR